MRGGREGGSKTKSHADHPSYGGVQVCADIFGGSMLEKFNIPHHPKTDFFFFFFLLFLSSSSFLSKKKLNPMTGRVPRLRWYFSPKLFPKDGAP